MTSANVPVMEVLSPGPFTSMQDQGRPGFRHLGIAKGGSADFLSASVANYLVGNDLTMPVLECTQAGPALKCFTTMTVAITGAKMPVFLNNKLVNLYTAFQVYAGDVLRLDACSMGIRSYIAIAGGFEGDTFFHSQATHLGARIGGHKGRSLVQGDVLYGTGHKLCMDVIPLTEVDYKVVRPEFSHDWILRVLPGPELSKIEDAREIKRYIFGRPFMASARSDRMGIRLKSDFSEKFPGIVFNHAMHSSAVYPGTLQWPIGGDPILLGCDAQTTGGYPRIVQVIAVDLPLMGQIRPGDRLWFREVTLQEAQEAFMVKTRLIEQVMPGFVSCST